MDSKETPVGSQQDNASVLTEIKDDLKKSLVAWESFLTGIEAALVYGEDWALAKKVSDPIVKSVKKIEQILELHEKKVCVLCNSHIRKDCVDWDCMAKANTKAVICKECSKLFENCKGDD